MNQVIDCINDRKPCPYVRLKQIFQGFQKRRYELIYRIPYAWNRIVDCGAYRRNDRPYGIENGGEEIVNACQDSCEKVINSRKNRNRSIVNSSYNSRKEWRYRIPGVHKEIGNGLEERAKLSGAAKLYIEDIVDDFADNYIVPCVQAHAVYEDEYLLGTSMARPAIAKRQACLL